MYIFGVKAQVSDIKQPALCQQMTNLSLDTICPFMLRELKTYLEMPGKETVGVKKKGGKVQIVILPMKLMSVLALWIFC